MSIFGYLDAGSGSLLLQALLGGLAGIAVAWRALKARVTGKKPADDASVADEPEQVTEGS